MARSMSRSFPVSAAGPAPSAMLRSTPGCAQALWASTAPPRTSRNIPAAAARCWCSRCLVPLPRTSRRLTARAMRNPVSIAVFGLALAFAFNAHAEGTLRVCANPNNLPFSNANAEGFENKLAELVARDLNKTVSYSWTNEHEHFVRKTVNAGKCDVLIGVPAEFDEVDTTM